MYHDGYGDDDGQPQHKGTPGPSMWWLLVILFIVVEVISAFPR